jgi:hypothetical protein
MGLMNDVATGTSKKRTSAVLDDKTREKVRQLKQHYDNLAPGVQRAERKRLRAELQRYTEMYPELASPAAGYVGFWCIIVGIIVPLLSSVGIVLCFIGLTQALVQKRPVGGYTIAGVVIGLLTLAYWIPLLMRVL